MNEHTGHRQRVKEDFLRNGFPQGAHQHKALELLLFFCVQQKDTNPLAHQLLNKYKNIAGVLDAPVEELAEFKGLSQHSAVLLKLIMPIARMYLADKDDSSPFFSSLDEMGEYVLKRYIGIQNEVPAILILNHRNQLIDFQFLSQGDVGTATVSIRDVVRRALNKNAASVVFTHNHPDGLAFPSPNDVNITKQLAIALSNVGVLLLDHILVAETDFVSLAQSFEFAHLFNTNDTI